MTRASSSVLSLEALPLFSTFFLWSFGSGAQQLARPLFAASFGVPVFLITLITSSNSISRSFTAPVTGLLTDLFGRKPLLLGGVAVRGITTVLEFFAGSYLEFLLLEFIGGIGVSAWITGSSILMADVTSIENRGRAMAIRSVSSRIGGIAGPAVGGILAATLGLRWLFLFNAATKLVQLLILLFLIHETRPEAAVRHATARRSLPWKEALEMFATRPFLLLASATLAFSMMGQGVFLAMFPVYVQEAAGLGVGDVGAMLTLAAAATLVATYPNGVVVDRYGRKKTLVPGLFVMALSAYLLAQVTDYRSVVIMALVYGTGEAMAMGSSQAYIADIAPEARRGTFLGAWSLFNSSGGVAAPLLIGLLADVAGFHWTFTVVAGLLVASAVAMALYGPESGGTRAQSAEASTGANPPSL